MPLLPICHRLRHAGWLLAAAGYVVPAHAVEFSASGFATVAVGKTSGACTTANVAPAYADDCTRFVTDWAHAGVYEGSWTAQPESRLGLQSTAKFSKELSATGQITSRALKDQHAQLEWLYLTYQPAPEWTIQAGRKRLPLYYYSDFQDVGYAYNLVRPTPDVYGWDIVNYNGISLARTATLGAWSVRAEALYGRESTNENKLLQIFMTAPQKITWSNIASMNVEFSRDWFTGRVSYTEFDHKDVDTDSGAVFAEGGARHKLLGVALNADIDDWIVRTEFGTAKRQSTEMDARFYLANVGYRLGNYTVTGGVSGYHENYFSTGGLNNKHRVLTAGVRYELHKGGALKLQFDKLTETTSGSPLLGSSRLITASYDVTF